MSAAELRQPLWGGGLTRHLRAEAGPPARGAAPAVLRRAVKRQELVQPEDPARIDPKALTQLGLAELGSLPSAPELLAERLKSDDEADARVDSDEFSRGIRRAVRLRLARSAGCHRRAGKTWKEWVSGHFKSGYECYQRYHIAADLQVGLISRGLPALVSSSQARALAPFRRHERFWDALSGDGFTAGFGSGNEITGRLRQALGMDGGLAQATPRLRLHRALSRLAKDAAASDDPAVAQAAAKIAQAIAILENGAA